MIKAVLVICAVLLAPVLFELFLRIATPPPQNLTKLKSSSLFIQENKPNAAFPYRGPEFDNLISINSYGFRDDEFYPQKPAGVTRIAVLGDSQEEALQVKLEDTWQKVMARSLAKNLGKKIETYNFGVSGYGTDQQWLTLREKVWQFSPDMIILAFSPNDVGDTYKNKLVYLENGQIKVRTVGDRAGGNFLGRIARETYLYHTIVKAASQKQITKRIVDKIRTKFLGFPKEERFFMSDAQLVQGPFEVMASQKNPPQEVADTWKIIKALVLDIKKQTQTRGARFLITVNIPRTQVDEASWKQLIDLYKLSRENSSPYIINEVIAQIAREAAVDFYDGRLDAIKWKNNRGILHLPQDSHFNKNGNLFMGEKTAEFIIKNNLIK